MSGEYIYVVLVFNHPEDRYIIRGILHNNNNNKSIKSAHEREEMSWQTYVDDHLMCEVEGNPGQHLTASAIVGHDGSVWAQSANFAKVTFHSFSLLSSHLIL